MLYAGEDYIIEATGQQDTGMGVRKISVQEYFGCSLQDITQGKRIDTCRAVGIVECHGESLIIC